MTTAISKLSPCARDGYSINKTTRANKSSRSGGFSPGNQRRCLHTNRRAIVFRTGVGGAWNATEEIVTPNNDTTYNIENLQPFTVYSFRVSAVNAMGRSKPSEETFHSVTLRERTFFSTTLARFYH